MAGNNSRSIGLDLLRFCVTTVVLSAHARDFGDAGKIFEIPGAAGKILRLLPASGWVAVDIFFVLSGFLVSGLLFHEAKESGTVSLRRFLIRRGLKIYPAFWAMVVCTVASILGHHGSISLSAWLSELFYFQNYGVFICFHTWSLAVEEHFYFLLAGLFWILKLRAGAKSGINFNAIPDLFLAVAVLCLLLRFTTWLVILNVTNQNSFWFTHADHALLDSLFFGVMLSHFWHNRWDDSVKQRLVCWRWAFLVTGLALVLPGVVPVMDLQWFRIFGFTLVYLGAGALILSCLALDYLRPPWIVGRLAWLGRHSYSVYLWHLLAGDWLYPWVSLNLNARIGWALDTLIYCAVAWLWGIVMARLVEFPILRIRDRFFPGIEKSNAAQDPLARRPVVS
jgi:peptidoglycan/LPS O-acetylase OafA/YrhL